MRQNCVKTKGTLSAVIQLTDMMRNVEFPIVIDTFVTGKKGQISGLGSSRLQRILKKHGIDKVLASEAGRTSRGNMALMQNYVNLMNTLQATPDFSIDEIEEYWAQQVREYFNNQPFLLKNDSSMSVSACIRDLFDQAEKRQMQNKGTQYKGTVLQHLVGAKIKFLMISDKMMLHGASVADSSTDRGGDFVISNTIIHCTTAPSGALIEKCRTNLNTGASPVIITLFDRVNTALNLAIDSGIGKRIEVWDIEQFLSSNVYEHSLFRTDTRGVQLSQIVDQYNKIIDEVESDPSLKIQFIQV